MRRALILLATMLAVASPASASNDKYFAQQWALAKMHVETSWRASQGDGIVVAVIDTGVDLGHPDLSGRLVPGRDFIDGDSTPQDENGHGTHMAGSIAAVAGNGIGIAGVAPRARIMPVRVLDESGRTDDPAIVREGIEWAVDHGARIINLSLAADGPGNPLGGQDLLATAPIDLAIKDAVSRGALVVVAAGNNENGGQAKTSYDATVEGALVVGASTNADRRAAYSNYGDGLDVIAPGGGSATDPDFGTGCNPANAVVGLYRDPKSGESQYAGACGTSVAVAQVSGIGALLMYRGSDNVEAATRIVDTAIDVGARGRDAQTGSGRVDAARALGVSGGRPGIGAAASTPASPKPKPSISPTQSSSPGASPSPLPSESSSPEGTPRAAGDSPEPGEDRSTPIAVAGALVFFTGWGLLTARDRRKRGAEL